MKNTNVPDFGTIISSFQYGDNKVELEARAIAPGLTLHDLTVTFEDASGRGNDLSGNPSNWSNTRGIEAVVDKVLEAVYSSQYKPCKCD